MNNLLQGFVLSGIYKIKKSQFITAYKLALSCKTNNY
jgi:hypothetical protein